jgi:hypothetical protein
MLYKLHGFAWYAYPDVLELAEGGANEAAADPGHPFANGKGGVHAPVEVVYFKRTKPGDLGVLNEHRDNGWLVLTSTQLHPKLCRGWESEPAVLSDTYKSEDGKVKMIQILHKHKRHMGELIECDLKVEHG